MAIPNLTVSRLEYCKINDLATKGSGHNKVYGEMKNEYSDFDLGILVEEVVTALCAGQQSQYNTNSAVRSSTSEPSANSYHFPFPSQSDETSIIIRIQKLDSWMVRSIPGAWRRILMNIINNALKWTKNGFIEVTISSARPAGRHGPSFVNVRVRDTGCGISLDFLKDKLFSPFEQEDPLSPGIGLGLNIARRLAISLGGKIDVKSEKGAGTQVDIFAPVEIAQSVGLTEPLSSITKNHLPQPLIKASIFGFQLQPEAGETPTGILSVKAQRKLAIRNAIMDVFATQLGWQLSPRTLSDRMHGDVAIIEEADLNHMLSEGLLPMTDFKRVQGSLIVLGNKTSILTDELPANIIRVPPP